MEAFGSCISPMVKAKQDELSDLYNKIDNLEVNFVRF